MLLHTIGTPANDFDTHVNETDDETETQILSDLSACPSAPYLPYLTYPHDRLPEAPITIHLLLMTAVRKL